MHNGSSEVVGGQTTLMVVVRDATWKPFIGNMLFIFAWALNSDHVWEYHVNFSSV